MSAICISYSRQSEAIVSTLVEDIAALGHGVWFDQHLSGGQVWWDQILSRIRECDVFVFALSPEALDSTACKREYQYAAKLGKPILPVLVAEEVSSNLLPAPLSAIQFVDYRTQDRDAALRLARALNSVPPPLPLPDPLPASPEVPISYLSELARQVEATSALGFEEQTALLVTLKRSLRKPEDSKDAHRLLQSLRSRRDLLASVADEIDEVLARSLPGPPASGDSGADSGSPPGPARRAKQEEQPPAETAARAPKSTNKSRVERSRPQSNAQKLAYGVLLVASLAFIVFCITLAVQYEGLASGDYGRLTQARSDLHEIVTTVSLAFYLPVFIVLVFVYRGTKSGSSWRYALVSGMLIALGMAFWSLLLSARIDYGEVWFVWLIASVLFALLSVQGLRGEKGRS